MPKLGDKSTCRMCGEEIEYIGPYWRHTQSSPRHPALPLKKVIDPSVYIPRAEPCNFDDDDMTSFRDEHRGEIL